MFLKSYEDDCNILFQIEFMFPSKRYVFKTSCIRYECLGDVLETFVYVQFTQFKERLLDVFCNDYEDEIE